jgi:Ran GTPase-activating protein (RanGAP) involved in mRNA processing and transport
MATCFIDTSLCLLALRAESGLGTDGCIKIAEMLVSNSTIQHLDLASNAIEDQGATAIARALATNTTLVKLELQRNGISSVGVRYMAEALKHNTTLESLGFAFNGCGDLVRGLSIDLPALSPKKTPSTLPTMGAFFWHVALLQKCRCRVTDARK